MKDVLGQDQRGGARVDDAFAALRSASEHLLEPLPDATEASLCQLILTFKFNNS